MRRTFIENQNAIQQQIHVQLFGEQRNIFAQQMGRPQTLAMAVDYFNIVDNISEENTVQFRIWDLLNPRPIQARYKTLVLFTLPQTQQEVQWLASNLRHYKNQANFKCYLLANKDALTEELPSEIMASTLVQTTESDIETSDLVSDIDSNAGDSSSVIDWDPQLLENQPEPRQESPGTLAMRLDLPIISFDPNDLNEFFSLLYRLYNIPTPAQRLSPR